jgi:L-ribulokinase
MAFVAGVDFGTLSVRVSIVDSTRGLLASAVEEYPLHRKRDDPDHATQSHADHMRALSAATRLAIREAGVSGDQVEAIALDTTGSSVIPVGAALAPLDEYYLWCDHRAKQEAAEITEIAHKEGLEALQWCGGVYSSEWGFAKLLHWLRHHSGQRDKFVTALEHCDMVAATLCGLTDHDQVKRSVCAMGHKWMWNPDLGGLPPETFLVKVDPCSPEFGQSLTADVKPQMRSQANSLLIGQSSWDCGPASRFPLAPLMLTGTQSVQVLAKAKL